MELQEQGYGAPTPVVPSNPAIGPSHPADFQTQYSQNSSNYAPQGPAYPGPLQQGYQPYSRQEGRSSTNARGRTVALLIILFGLLLILIAMTLFILERNNVFG